MGSPATTGSRGSFPMGGTEARTEAELVASTESHSSSSIFHIFHTMGLLLNIYFQKAHQLNRFASFFNEILQLRNN